MSHIGVERRRAPRVEPRTPQSVSLETSIPVQVIDLSQAGVQLSSKFALTAGERAELRTTLGSRSMRLPLEICRVTVQNHGRGGAIRYVAGATLGSVSVEQRLFLQQTLNSEPR